MQQSNFSYSFQRYVLVYLVWWILWCVIQTVALIYMQLPWQMAFLDSIISNSLLALACWSAIQMNRFYQPSFGNSIYRLVFALGFTAIYCYALKWILQYFFFQEVYYIHFVQGSMPIRFLFSLLMLSFITVLYWLIKNLESQKNQQSRQAEALQLSKEAELVKIRQQLQPHFLFNSLNSISALAGSQPQEARKMIQQLSHFLRGTLKKDEQQTVLLKEEIEHLNLYLEIEKVRFGQRLTIEMSVDEIATTAKLPPLLLQPIVENAIKFGLYGTTENISISIQASIANNFLHIEIANPFDEESQPDTKGTGFGLSSIQRRLYLMYSRQDLLKIEKQANKFITKLMIPQFE